MKAKSTQSRPKPTARIKPERIQATYNRKDLEKRREKINLEVD